MITALQGRFAIQVENLDLEFGDRTLVEVVILRLSERLDFALTDARRTEWDAHSCSSFARE